MIECPNCLNQNKVDAKFCSNCGTVLNAVPLPNVAQVIVAQEQRSEGEVTNVAGQLATPRPAFSPTTKLTSAPPSLTALSEGELLQDERFIIETVLDATENLNKYLVYDRKQKRCSNCRRVDSGDGAYCENCGHQLGQSYYIVTESFSPEAFQNAKNVIEAGIQADSLVNVYETWSESPFEDSLRYFLLQEPIAPNIKVSHVQEAIPLSDLSESKIQPVLRLGQEVAMALDALLAQGIGVEQLRREQLWLVDGLIRFDVISNLACLTSEKIASGVKNHVQALAGILREMLGDNGANALEPVLEQAVTVADSPSALALVEELEQVFARQVAPPPPPMRYIVAARSDLGRVREINEDSLLTLELSQIHESVNYPLRLVAVADGMGGHSAGEIASRLVLNNLASKVANLAFSGARDHYWPPAKSVKPVTTPMTWGEMLEQACKHAARIVYDEGQRLGSDMGATLVTALIADGSAYVINIGDSRLYQLNEQGIVQITQDHSLGQLLITQQGFTPEEAMRHPNANHIYRSVGERANVECDLFTVGLQPGDFLLLCSDGLSGLVSDEQMLQTVRASAHPAEACDALVRMANEAAGHDNITVVIVKVEDARTNV